MAENVRHLSREVIEELLRADYPSPESIAEAIEHLLMTCPTCRSRVSGLQADEESMPSASPRLLHDLAGRLEAAQRLMEDSRKTAEKDFAELLALDSEPRRIKIKRATTRFKSLLLVNHFLEESFRRAPSYPFEAQDLAECAYDLVLRLPSSEYGKGNAMTALARANASRANALRILGDLRQADRLLTQALHLFDQEGSGDPEVDAELHRLMSNLRGDQRQFAKAETHLNRALSRYRELDDEQAFARCLVQKGILLRRAGDPEKALAATEEALRLINRETDPHLYCTAEHNMVDYLIDLGRFSQARNRHRQNRPLYDVVSPELAEVRYGWLEGKIARGLGEREKAEELLVVVRTGLISLGMGFAAAIAGLDLALVYLEQRRPEKVHALAEEMIPIFLAQDVHREAVAALLLFQEAARQEAVTVQMVVEIMDYMHRVRSAPPERPS